ncbi:MAG: hypothetical protein MZV63_72430 [Marinilabiliales bacterium]|nr:hypothetical protein [Marinilabiliales bacterium]
MVPATVHFPGYFLPGLADDAEESPGQELVYRLRILLSSISSTNGWFLFAILRLLLLFPVAHTLPGRLPCPAAECTDCLVIAVRAGLSFCRRLWMRLPAWMYWTAVAAGLLTTLAALYYFSQVRYSCVQVEAARAEVSATVKWLWGFALLAFVLKILMQALTVIPAVTHLAFGFRPIVIGLPARGPPGTGRVFSC